MKLKSFLKNNLLRVVFAAAGALAGFLYWKYVGCESGTCPIKSVWYWSTLYGIILGFLLGDLLSSYFAKRKKDESVRAE